MSGVYNRAKYSFATGAYDTATDTLKVMLVTGSYTFDADHNYVSDVTNELSGGNYVRKTLASVTITEDDANDYAYLDAADITWSSLNAGTAAAAVVFKYVTSDALSPLIAYITLTPAIVTDGGDLVLSWNPFGIVRLS